MIHNLTEFHGSAIEDAPPLSAEEKGWTGMWDMPHCLNSLNDESVMKYQVATNHFAVDMLHMLIGAEPDWQMVVEMSDFAFKRPLT